MSGFLASLLDDYELEIERHRNRPFLKASMAACALAAVADGAPTLSERIRVDQILETLEELKIFDPHEGVDLFNEFSTALLESPVEGHKKALDAVRAVSANPDAGALLVRMCLAVADAKGQKCRTDEVEIEAVCNALRLDPGELGVYRNDSVEARVEESV
jgi:tellurite resistance protein TerB